MCIEKKIQIGFYLIHLNAYVSYQRFITFNYAYLKIYNVRIVYLIT